MISKICYSEFFCLELVQKGSGFGLGLFFFGCLCQFLKIKKTQWQRQVPVQQLTFKGDCQIKNIVVIRKMTGQEGSISLNGDSPYLTGI